MENAPSNLKTILERILQVSIEMWLASQQGGIGNTFMFSFNWWPDKSRNKGLKIEIKINQGHFW